MAPSKQWLPGGDAARKPGEGVPRGDLQLRGGARSLRRRHTDGQFVRQLHQNVTLRKERQNNFEHSVFYLKVYVCILIYGSLYLDLLVRDENKFQSLHKQRRTNLW